MKTKRQNLFTTVRTEGAILPADLLQRVAEGDGELDGLRPEDYHLSGEKLNEAINRSWNRLLGAWKAFQNALEKLPDDDPATSVTREKWLLPLFRELDYGRLPAAKAVEIEEKSYPISHFWEQTPIHLLGWRIDLDRRTRRVAGAATTSPHSMIQEFLNRSDDHLWAFVSNGQTLRILRDNVSLTRQAYVEFDLKAMVAGEVYADFKLLWLICHQSRVEILGNRESAVGSREKKPDSESPPTPDSQLPTPSPHNCWLEKWSETANKQGTRALDQLRKGVEEAIKALGRGFLTHPKNGELREKLYSGTLPAQDYYRQLLRVVYRLLFLFVAEDRELLLAPNADEEAGQRYTRYYSTFRLRQLAERHRGTRHSDLYYGLVLVMEKLGSETGCPELGLPALGSFLWSEEAIADLVGAHIANAELLAVVRVLAFTVDANVLRAVDYKNLGAEELGSIYESLLELHPEINQDAGTFELGTAAGHERKTTGSYYTPTSLINCLLDSALDPVVDEAVKGNRESEGGSRQSAVGNRDRQDPDSPSFPDSRPHDLPTPSTPESRILALKVCDPACGSGHFLIAAAHRIGKRLAAVRTGDEEPAPDAVRHAVRDVIGNCIFGVDLNPMAVELCKINLWLESLEPGKPLSFLDHHIQCGNSLLGATPALLKKGIPDEAFKPIEGDDKKLRAEMKKLNRDERRGQMTLDFEGTGKPWERLGDLATTVAQLDEGDDDTVAEVRNKQERYEKLVNSSSYQYGRLWADAWCAAFVWKKTKEFDYGITEEVFRRIERNPHSIPPWMRDEIGRLASEYKFFHWHLAFPQVFQVAADSEDVENERTGRNGGFNVVLGNPPWERIKIYEKEWFSTHLPEISHARNAAARRRLIQEVEKSQPTLWRAYSRARRLSEGQTHLLRDSGLYPLCAHGDLNTYSVFTELDRNLLAPYGRSGCIIPCGIVTDNTTRLFFQDIVRSQSLVSVFGFINERMLFPDVLHNFKFCLMVLCGRKSLAPSADFAFNCYDVSDLSEEQRHFTLTDEDVHLLNPNTKTCPVFFWKRSAEITKSIYRRVPILHRHGARNDWGITIFTMFHMSNDSDIFLTSPDKSTLPLYEAKMFHQFNHRFASHEHLPQGERSHMLPETSVQKLQCADYCVAPCYSVPKQEVKKRIQERYPNRWLLGFRDTTSAGLYRTTIYSALPICGTSNKVPLLSFPTEAQSVIPSFFACMNSFILDFVSRQKLGGASFNFFVKHQLPILPPRRYHENSQWQPDARLADWIAQRVVELSYTAWELQPFAADYGYDGPPFLWDEERRFLLRSELDAAYFHLYLGPPDQWGTDSPELGEMFPTPRDAVDYIMKTFPIVKRKDERQHGEYRTKRVILDIYDAMQEAIDSGQPYQTLLDPPPGPPRDAEGHFIPMAEWDPNSWPAHIHQPREAVVAVPEEVPAAEFAAMAYPAIDADQAICAAALAVVEQSGGLSSTEHLDALLLATHPGWCKAFLDSRGQAAFDAAQRVAPGALFVGQGESIHWKECRDYLEQLNAIAVGHSAKNQPIRAGTALTSGKTNLPSGVDGMVECALKALARIRELRRDLSSVPQAQRLILDAFEEQHRRCGLAA